MYEPGRATGPDDREKIVEGAGFDCRASESRDKVRNCIRMPDHKHSGGQFRAHRLLDFVPLNFDWSQVQ